MTYPEFKRTAVANGWGAAEIRCDVPPTAALLAFIDAVGSRYERYALRFAAECAK